MTQSFAKKNSFSAIQLNDMCKMYSGTVTVTAGGGDVTVSLPFNWTGGHITVIASRATGDWSTDDATQRSFQMASYDSLTNAGYTSDQVFTCITGNATQWRAEDKGNDESGILKSATATSFTLDDNGANTVYVKYFIYAPYTATIQMDGSNIISSGSGAPATTPSFIGQEYLDTAANRWYKSKGVSSSADWLKVPVFYSGTATVTGGSGDVTVTLPWDWSGGYLVLIKSTDTNWADAYNSSRHIRFETSYDALTNAAYVGRQIFYLWAGGVSAGECGGLTKDSNEAGLPKSATSTTFVLDDNGNTRYIKYFVWA